MGFKSSVYHFKVKLGGSSSFFEALFLSIKHRKESPVVVRTGR